MILVNPNCVTYLSYDEGINEFVGVAADATPVRLGFVPPFFVAMRSYLNPEKVFQINPNLITVVLGGIGGCAVRLRCGTSLAVMENYEDLRISLGNIWRQQYEGQPAYAPLHHTHKKGE